MSESVSAGEGPNRLRRRRWPWYVLGGLVAVLLVAALALPALLDVERYRGNIEDALSAATGWQAELGAIEFSLWRGMVLTVQPASLVAPGDTSRFDAETIEIRAEILPLLKGSLKVRSITLVGPEILLVRRSLDEGWIVPGVLKGDPSTSATSETAGSAPAGSEDVVEGKPSETPASGAGAKEGFEVTIDQIGVRDGRIVVDDRVGDPPLSVELEGLNLNVMPSSGEMTGEGRLADGGGDLEWKGNYNEALTLTLGDVPSERLHPFFGPDLIHSGGRISGDIQLAFPLEIRGDLTGKNLTLLDGQRPFDAINVEMVIKTAGDEWRLDVLDVDADGVRLEGRGTLTPNLALDIDLTRTPLEAALRATESVMPLPLDVEPPGAVEARLHVEQPAGRTLFYTARGDLSAAKFRPSEILPPVEDVQATFELDRNGQLVVRVNEANVGGGPATGVARLSSIDPPGSLSFEGGLQDAVFGALVQGFLGESARALTGPTGLDAALALDLGREVIDARALSGRIDLSSQQVSLPGWDLEGAIRKQIDAKLKEMNLQSLVASRLSGDSKGSSEQNVPALEQVIDNLEASVDFDSWPWKLEKLTLQADHVAADGNGTFDPVTGAVNLQFTARLDRQRTQELVQQTEQLKYLVGKDGRLTLPLEISGAMLSPSIGVDLGQAFSNQLDTDDTRKKVEGLIKGLLDRD
jgi:hypothetical protein